MVFDMKDIELDKKYFKIAKERIVNKWTIF